MSSNSSIVDIFLWSKINSFILGGEIIEDVNSQPVKYYPFEEFKDNNIYKEFVSLNYDNNDDGIVRFVNKYGFLEEDLLKLTTNQRNLRHENNGGSGYSESIVYFREEVKRFSQIVVIKSCLDSIDYTPLGLYNKILSLNIELVCLTAQILISGVIENISREDVEFKETQLLIYSKRIIAAQINDKIKSVNNRLSVIEDGNDIVFKENWFSPDLLTVMYLMFYFDIINKRIIRRCSNKYCNKFFVVEGNRLNKIYCSSECANSESTRKWRTRNKKKK